MMWGTHGFMGGFMWIFWILVIIGIILLVKSFISSSSTNKRPQDPKEILERRYASGEIGRSEYEQKRKDLDWLFRNKRI